MCLLIFPFFLADDGIKAYYLIYNRFHKKLYRKKGKATLFLVQSNGKKETSPMKYEENVLMFIFIELQKVKRGKYIFLMDVK